MCRIPEKVGNFEIEGRPCHGSPALQDFIGFHILELLQ